MTHLGVLLDDWCRSYGWDPHLVWRARHDLAFFRARWMVGLPVVPDPSKVIWVI
jgi:hypothetical protein